MVRKETFPIKVTTGEIQQKIIQDIYVTELGHVMISIYDETKRVFENHRVAEIQNLLPSEISIYKG